MSRFLEGLEYTRNQYFTHPVSAMAFNILQALGLIHLIWLAGCLRVVTLFRDG